MELKESNQEGQLQIKFDKQDWRPKKSRRVKLPVSTLPPKPEPGIQMPKDWRNRVFK